MKTLTITIPDDVHCVALTTVAIKGAGVHTFTNCFDVSENKDTRAEIYEKSSREYELRTDKV